MDEWMDGWMLARECECEYAITTIPAFMLSLLPFYSLSLFFFSCISIFIKNLWWSAYRRQKYIFGEPQ
eukprot:m.25341 g.25341  ORF g.25341 m.25341 type:complete len:68 (-) comp5755_c0_seq1:42-245(-)